MGTEDLTLGCMLWERRARDGGGAREGRENGEGGAMEGRGRWRER